MKLRPTTVESLSAPDPAFWVRLSSPLVCPSSMEPFPSCSAPVVPYAPPSVDPWDLGLVLPLNSITNTAKFRTLKYYDRIAYLVAAGAMQGGTAIEVTINFKTIDVGDELDELWRPLLRKLLRMLKATGWPGRHMWVEVKKHTKTSKKTGRTKTTQHHVHLILFNAGPGTAAFVAMQEFQLQRNIEKSRSCSIRVKSLAEIRSYIFKNKHWDRGSIGADKLTLREAHAMARLPAIELWNRWRETAPAPPKGCAPLPEVPLILIDREKVEAGTDDKRRKRQKAKAKRAYERDQRRRAVAALVPARNCFDVLDEIEPGAFGLLDELSTPPGAFDVLDDLDIRPTALAGESGAAMATRAATRQENARPELLSRVPEEVAGRSLDPLLAMFRRVDEFRPSG